MTADEREVLTRPAPPADLTVVYGEHPDQVADVRMPPAGVPVRGAVIFVHGGFWRAGYDRAHTGPLASDLASRGYAVASLEYRRTGQPGGGWPGTFDDVAAGVRAVAGTFAQFGTPVVAGHSAGGHLALWVAHEVPVRGVLALAPVADLARTYALGLDDDAVRALLGGGPDEVPERYAAADPAVLPPPPARTIVVHGTADDLVPVALGRDYASAARNRGGDVEFVELAAVGHFGVIDPRSSAWPAVLAAVEALAGVDGVPECEAVPRPVDAGPENKIGTPAGRVIGPHRGAGEDVPK